MKHVCILNGIHRGAVVAVGEGAILIGGDAACDALLSDASVGDSTLRIDHDSKDRLTVEVVAGSASLNGRILRDGKPLTFADGTVASLGGVDIAIGSDLSAAQAGISARGERRMVMNWGAVAVACTAIFAFIGIVGGPADAYNALRGGVIPAERVVAVSAIQRGDPIMDLKREIERMDLSDVIEVRHSEIGKINATGAVNMAERERWESVVRWFDGRFGDMALLNSSLTERQGTVVLPFRIVSIRSMPQPRVTTENGETYPIGAIMPGGWTLRAIDGNRVDLSRDDRMLTISF